jgi:hypothetical protein
MSAAMLSENTSIVKPAREGECLGLNFSFHYVKGLIGKPRNYPGVGLNITHCIVQMGRCGQAVKRAP